MIGVGRCRGRRRGIYGWGLMGLGEGNGRKCKNYISSTTVSANSMFAYKYLEALYKNLSTHQALIGTQKPYYDRYSESNRIEF